MKLRDLVIPMVVGFSLQSCGKSPKTPDTVLKSVASSKDFDLFQQELAESAAPISLGQLLKEPSRYGLDTKLEEQLKSLDDWQNLEVDMPVTEHKNLRGQAALFVYVPNINEKEIKELVGYDRLGRKVILPADKVPDRPVITLAHREDLPMDATESFNRVPSRNRAGHVGGQMLKSILIHDIQEPWFKGAAEVYLVVTFIGTNGKGSTNLVPLPAVDKAGVRYNTNKVIHYWTQNKFQIADIAFFEKDSNYNYSTLAKIFVGAASTITAMAVDPSSAVAGIIGAVSPVLVKVIDALPNSWLTDDDDFIDAINTMEKYRANERYLSVGNNVDATIGFYQISRTDER